MTTPFNEAFRPLRVVDQRVIAGPLRLLVIERDLDFIAGQVLGLSTEVSIPPRLYSIASGERETVWEILYTVESEGVLTPRLAGLRAGDKVFVSGPVGDFTADKGRAVWVAGGTGIAPFLSIARSRSPVEMAEILLVHGGSLPEYFHGEGTFSALLGSNYVRCCSRAAEGDDRFFRGRVTAYLASRPELPLDRPWLLCGGSEFVVDTRDLLISRGLDYSFVRAEVYF
jgi:ferredoxin--NADP+ reductase